jgi:hypothetical protein
VADACAADACAIDLIPVVPGISSPGSSGTPYSFSSAGDAQPILYGEDLRATFKVLEECIGD